MKKLMTFVLTVALCASLALPALAAEGADPGLISGEEPGVETAPSVEPGIAPSDAPETAQTNPASASAPEAPPETDETVPIDPNAEAETAETDPETTDTGTAAETIETEMPLVVSFSDVPASHTFYSGITYCAGKGIVGGYPDGTFKPANTVTKNHFCAMLARAFYPDQVEKFNTDQYKNAYGTFGPTNVALANNGTLSKTSFQYQYSTASVMNSGINRYDMAQLMTNIMRAKGFTASNAQKNAAQAKITDYKNIPSQYQDAVKNVYALGVIGGYADGRFVGTNIMNRGQAAIVIQRMAQYAPVQGDKDNDTYDDGTEQKPSTGNTGNTGSSNTGSTNTGSNTGSTGNTGNTGTTVPTPEPKPETPAARTLSNGKAITESNVTAILSQLKTKYPNGTDFSKGYAGLGSGRSAANNCIAKITNQYGFTTSHNQHVSTTAGCGGWAAFVADEIFGQTGVTWKKTTMANVRPGDLLITLDANGYLVHVSICVGPVSGYPTTKRINVASTSAGSSGIYHIGWNLAATSTTPYDVWTAYPD